MCANYLLFSVKGLGILCIFLSILILSLESSFSSSFSDSFKSAISVLLFFTCYNSVIFEFPSFVFVLLFLYSFFSSSKLFGS